MKEQYWAKVIESQTKSGKSVWKYCQEQGISYGMFRYWHKILSKTKEIPVPKEAGFTEISLPAVSREIVLRFPGDIQMVVSSEVDPVWLRQLIFGNV